MKFSVPSAIIGAICGAAVSSIVGPVMLDLIRSNYLRDSDWEGEWKTITCFPEASYEWDVTFSQVGNKVTGRYVGAREDLKNFSGLYLGEVSVTSLSGTWTQLSNTGPIGGTFAFTLEADGKSFSGNYTNQNSGQQAIWLGRRNGERPSCG